MSSYYYADRNKPWIPEEWFVGLHCYKGGEEPLGFMVPEGDDKQAEERKDTVRSWARGRRHRRKKSNNDPKFRTVESKPLSGYRVASVTKRHGRESNRELFRVVDPRGFELEIDPENFLKIMRNTFVEQGEIYTELIWVRAGSNNLLIPTGSEDYEEAVEETKVRRNDLGMGDIELGWTVRFQRGMKGQYLGRWDLIKKERTRRRRRRRSSGQGLYEWEFEIEVNTNRRYAFFDRENGVLIVHSSPDPGAILDDSSTVSYEEAAEIVNNNVDNINRAGSSGYHRIVGFTRDRGDSLTTKNTGGGSVEVEWNTGEMDENIVRHVDM